MSRSKVTGFAAVAFFTVTIMVADLLAAVAVMIASPSPTGVTTPAGLTIATPGALVE